MSQDIVPMKSPITDEKVARYVVEKIVVESPIEHELRLETLKLPNNQMISSSDVGALLTLLVRSIGGQRALEIGTFTGYTALKIASALPAKGQLICCDINAEWTAIGKRFWKKAELDSKIELRLAPALETLNGLLAAGEAEHFDFAFIDADKQGYDAYYEVCLKLLRPGGLIVLDNMLWSGRVADTDNQEASTVAIRKLNEKISHDGRVESCLLTVGDGLMLARKK